MNDMTNGKYKDLIKLPGFQSYLWTQFLGVFNDHTYKIIVSLWLVNLAADSAEAGRNMALAGAIFILPFILFSGYAGHMADVFDKRRVLVVTKSFEIVVMGLAHLAFLTKSIEFSLGVLFLMALQSTFFSPAKYGILPEMLPDKELSRANGLVGMSTFLAIILGTAIGSFMFDAWDSHLESAGIFLVLIAVAGTLTSFGISRVPPSGASKVFKKNPFKEIKLGLKQLSGNKPLLLTAFGLSYFWFLGALIHMDIILFGKEVMGLSESRVGILVAFLAIGIGVGSLVAGQLSGDKIELGLLPLGGIGMGVFSTAISWVTSSFTLAAVFLVLLGFSGGLFTIPLNAYLQQQSGRKEKGLLIATTNFMNMTGILLSSAMLWLFSDFMKLPADKILVVFGLITIGITLGFLALIPELLSRFLKKLRA